MSPDTASEIKLEIGHVLFIDIVGYSNLLITQQSEQLKTLRTIVRGTAEFRAAEKEGKLLRLPTGDGGALVFRTTPETPVLCALEISKELKEHPELRVRMGIHSGPVNAITDLNEQSNIAGAGINIAQRVMDCGDAGHILLSKHVAEDLEHYPRWQPYLHDLGECEVKHGVRISVMNFYTDDVGNPALPEKFRVARPVRADVPPKRAKSVVGVAIGIGAFAALGILAALILPAMLRSRGNAKGEPAEASSVAGKSIAVLPFENLSRDPDNAYFVEGIQDEILTRLSKIADLKVISRTSTQKFKSAPDNLRDVARQLGVANILEGSVQKIANAVHVNVQLIRSATDEHVWAESYNRTLNDVFGVEGEVATAIADQLNAKLTGTEQKAVAAKPTQNAAAYDAYLRGLSIEHNEYSNNSYLLAANDYAEAVRLDPNFALAWGRLAAVRSFLYFNRIELNTNTPAAVKEAADRAMALAPEAGESWIARGSYRYRVQRDFAGALAAYQEAQKRLPNNSLVYQYMAYVQRRLGRWQDAEASYKKALALDPRDVQLLSSMGNEFYSYLRRFDDALTTINRALEISPDSESTRGNKANVLQSAGRLSEAAQELARIPANSTDDWVVWTRLTQALYERQYDVAIDIAERKLNATPAGQPLTTLVLSALVNSGYCHAWTGQPEPARRDFTRVINELKPTPDADVPADANGTPIWLALAYAGLGEKENALKRAQHALKAYETDAIGKAQTETVLAQIQAQLGDREAAIAALPQLLEVPAGVTTADLRFNPFWDPLRKDPRFQKLCEEKPKRGGALR
jgi:TolB-like protein/class 3 adenylate cyclase/Tfp pilus assembly protein PilF